MDIKWSRLCIICILTLVCLCIACLIGSKVIIVQAEEGIIVHAEEEKTSVETYSQALTAASLSGYESTNTQYFEIESYWQIKNAVLKLNYNISPIFDEHQSSITLVMNGTPFHSFHPTAVEDEMTVVIPEELLSIGVNTLVIEGSRATTSHNGRYYNICETEHNREHWLTIKDTSTISFTYTKHPKMESINEFYRAFIGVDTVKSQKHALMINSSPSSKELEAALYSIAGLAYSKTDANQSIPLLEREARSLANKEMLIYITHYQDLPPVVADKLGHIDVQQRAIMKLIQLDNQQVLVVTSESEELLVKAGQYIANQDLMLQTSSAEKWIDELTETATPALEISRMLQLSESGDRLAGPKHQEKDYFIALPANQAIAKASKIRIDMRYSQNLDFNRSLVTILINDKPIGSKKLSEALANQDMLELSIPTNLDVNGNFTVTIAFDLELEHLPCVVYQDQMPWAYIDSSSTLQLNTVERNDLLFNYYPSNFMSQGGFNSIAVVLPSELTGSDYNALANVFHLLGRSAQTNFGELQVFSDTVDPDLLAGKQLIVLGSFHNHQLLRKINDQLYFRYDEHGDGFVSNEKKSLEREYSKKNRNLATTIISLQ